MDADAAAITQATHDWVASFQAADMDAALAPVADDIVAVPPNEPQVVGKDAFEAWGRGMFEAIKVDEASVTLDDVRVAGDLGVCAGSWHMTGTAGGAPMQDTTRFILIWERRNGEWKVVRDVWNSALPAGG